MGQDNANANWNDQELSLSGSSLGRPRCTLRVLLCGLPPDGLPSEASLRSIVESHLKCRGVPCWFNQSGANQSRTDLAKRLPEPEVCVDVEVPETACEAEQKLYRFLYRNLEYAGTVEHVAVYRLDLDQSQTRNLDASAEESDASPRVMSQGGENGAGGCSR
jgi:hypothetical protein